MANHTIKVVKSKQVQVSDTVSLGPSLGGWLGLAPMRPRSAQQGEQQDAQVPQEARIIESNSEYAIIEVTCSCGAKSHIQCNYADVIKE